MANKQTEYSIQYLENLSADLSVNPPILRRGLVGKDASGNYYNIAVSPTGDLGANGAMSISKSVVGTVTTTTVDKTIGDKTYRQTIVSDSADGSVGISAWSEV